MIHTAVCNVCGLNRGGHQSALVALINEFQLELVGGVGNHCVLFQCSTYRTGYSKRMENGFVTTLMDLEITSG